MKRIIIPIIIIGIIIILIVINLKGGGGKKVEVKPVRYGSLSQAVDGNGSLRAKAQVDISSQVIGQVKRIYIKEGKFVKKGELLLNLDDVSYRAEFTKAKAQIKDARRSFERAKRLHEQQLIADEELEKAELSLQLARAQYNRSKDQLDKTEIRAPISGRVLSVNVETGETVLVGTMNNPGTVLVTIADLSMMIAEIEVGETEIPSVKLGQKAIVRIDAVPDTSFPGQVVKVGYMPISTLTTLERTTDFEVEIELKNPGSLRPGMSADAEIMTVTKDSVLVIPIQAISKRREGMSTVSSVFIFEDGRAVKKKVKTGISSEREIEITEGLRPDELVIIGPYRILSKLKGGEKLVKEEVTDTSNQNLNQPRRLKRVRRATRR